MRKRASVMERIGWEQKWARMGVKAVIDPQAAADSRRTFSPPTLRTQNIDRLSVLALTSACSEKRFYQLKVVKSGTTLISWM